MKAEIYNHVNSCEECADWPYSGCEEVVGIQRRFNLELARSLQRSGVLSALLEETPDFGLIG